MNGYDEKMEEIRNSSASIYLDYMIKELESIDDINMVIMKGHFFVEYCINLYLESMSLIDDSDFFNEKLNFETKLKMIDILDIITNEIVKLNDIRNKISNNLSYHESELNQIFKRVHEMSPLGSLCKEDSSTKQKIIDCIRLFSYGFFWLSTRDGQKK